MSKPIKFAVVIGQAFLLSLKETQKGACHFHYLIILFYLLFKNQLLHMFFNEKNKKCGCHEFFKVIVGYYESMYDIEAARIY